MRSGWFSQGLRIAKRLARARLNRLAVSAKTVLQRSGDLVYIRVPFNGTYDYVWRCRLNTTGGDKDNNAVFDVQNEGYILKSTRRDLTASASITLKDGDADDLCPSVVEIGYQGAHHGYLTGCRVVVSSHDKTAVDVGSEWKDGSDQRFILIRINSGTSLDFLPKVNPLAALTAAAGNLTHVTGATHTGAIVKSSSSTVQVKPSVGRSVTQFYSNNFDPFTLEDGEIRVVSRLRVRNYYEYMDPRQVVSYMIANVGSNPAKLINDSSIPSPWLSRELHFFFDHFGVCVIDDTTTVLTNLTGLNLSTVQSGQPTIPGGGSRLYYCPRLKAYTDASGWIWAADSTCEPTSGASYPSPTNYRDASKPVDRVAQLVRNSSGDVTGGWMMGYGSELYDSADSKRITAVNDWPCNFSLTKAYMGYWRSASAMGPANPPAGMTKRSIGYHFPLDVSKDTDAHVLAGYWVGETYYYFVDFNDSVTLRRVAIDPRAKGMKISVLESIGNISILNSVASDASLLVTTIGYGGAALKLTH